MKLIHIFLIAVSILFINNANATDPTGNWVAYGVRTIDQSNIASSQFQVFQQEGFYTKADCNAFIASQQALAGWNNGKSNNIAQRVDAKCNLVKMFQ